MGNPLSDHAIALGGEVKSINRDAFGADVDRSEAGCDVVLIAPNNGIGRRMVRHVGKAHDHDRGRGEHTDASQEFGEIGGVVGRAFVGVHFALPPDERGEGLLVQGRLQLAPESLLGMPRADRLGTFVDTDDRGVRFQIGMNPDRIGLSRQAPDGRPGGNWGRGLER